MMPVAWTLKTAPVLWPVTKAQLKIQIRHGLAADDTTEDDLLDRLIASATAWVEQYTGRSLLTQTWQMSLPEWADVLWLPRAAPLQSLAFVKYYDAANVLQTLAATVYTVPAFHEPAIVRLADAQVWPATHPRTDAVQLEYITGATAAAAVPTPLTQSVMLLASHWYDHRESVLVGSISKELEFSVTALCAFYRLFWRAPVAA